MPRSINSRCQMVDPIIIYSNSKVWFGDDQGVMSAIPPWFHKWVRRYARNADSLSQAKAPKQATLMKDELERSIDIVMASVLG